MKPFKFITLWILALIIIAFMYLYIGLSFVIEAFWHVTTATIEVFLTGTSKHKQDADNAAMMG